MLAIKASRMIQAGLVVGAGYGRFSARLFLMNLAVIFGRGSGDYLAF